LTVTSDSTATNTEIATAFAAAINGMPELSVTAAVSMSALVVTAKAGFPIFTLTTSDTKLSISTSAGTVGAGTGTSLIGTYPSTAGYFNAGGFTAASSIVATNNYTQVLVTSTTGGSAVILVNVAATNFNDLLGTYGTITGLKAGYRAIIVDPSGNVTINGYVATGGTNAFAIAQLQSGDFIVNSSDGIAKVLGVPTSATAIVSIAGTNVAGTFDRISYWRNLPL
jgi:hypothetical protein